MLIRVPYARSGVLRGGEAIGFSDFEAGQVEAVGRIVTRLEPSDEILGGVTEYGYGAFAEYACAPEAAFALRPAGMTFEEAATVPQAGGMALQGLC